MPPHISVQCRACGLSDTVMLASTSHRAARLVALDYLARYARLLEQLLEASTCATCGKGPLVIRLFATARQENTGARSPD